jgi:hypothetical protein
MDQYISTVYSLCASHFEQLLRSLHATQNAEGLRLAQIEQLSSGRDRFKVWAVNVGAAHSGKEYESSLDYRLRNAPAYKDLVKKILLRVDELLVRGQQTLKVQIEDSAPQLSEDSLSEEGDPAENSEEEEQLPSWSSSESDSEANAADAIVTEQVSQGNIDSSAPAAAQRRLSSAGRIQDIGKTNYTLQSVLDSLNLAIASLFKIPVRTAAPLSRLDRYGRRNDPLMTAFERFDHQFVVDLYPSTELPLVARISAAITRRRRLLRYRRQHNDKLKRDKVDSSNSQLEVQAATEAAKPENQPLLLGALERPANVPVPESVALSTLKATTFRPVYMEPPNHLLEVDEFSEAESISSSGSSAAGLEQFILPPRPKNADGEDLLDFECRFCCTAVHVRRTKRAWK